MCSNEFINDTKLEYTEYNFKKVVLVIDFVHVIIVQKHNHYNINEKGTSLKIILFILVILCIEM
jgi:hypothetical protein